MRQAASRGSGTPPGPCRSPNAAVFRAFATVLGIFWLMMTRPIEDKEELVDALHIEPIGAPDHGLLHAAVERWFGGEPIFSPTRHFSLDELSGLKAVHRGETIGVACYTVTGDTCEIVVQVSLHRGKGVGTGLVNAVQTKAEQQRCRRLLVYTTNDNLDALRFYQRRGFEIVAVHRNAMSKIRQVKPQVPLVGANGIPLRDMIELEKPMGRARAQITNPETSDLPG
jgi:DNA-3-methyladenine glycosylase I